MKQFKAVFWDFDGVWSKDVFYKSLAKDRPQLWEFIQTSLWKPTRDKRIEKWMKGQLTMDDINKYISRGSGVSFEELTQIFLKDAAKMDIETRHIPIVRALKNRGIKVGMITNNMDVFDVVTKPRLKLDKLFDGVFNSFSHKKLKADGLFDIAVQALNNADYKTALMIDDSPRARGIFEAKGGSVYAYDGFERFKKWVGKNLLL